jgi:mercuric ion transport protein
LPIVLLALSGTAAGALVSQHKGIAVVVLLTLFALSLTRALSAFRSPR